MDAPFSNQGQSSLHQWVTQTGWSTAEPPEPFCNPLPSFHQLNLDSVPDQNHIYNQLQASGNDPQDDSVRRNAHHSLQHISDADQNVQQRFSDAVSAANRGQSLSSPPLMNEQFQPLSPQQMTLYSPYSPRQIGSSPLQFPQATLNAPQSSHLPGQHVHLSPQSVPQPEFDGANVGSPVGYGHRHPPTSPNQPQPQWMSSAHSRGTINTSASQERIMTPQSLSSESRYGLDPKLLPSAVKVMEEDEEEWGGKVFVSEHFSRLPPLATTPYLVEDKEVQLLADGAACTAAGMERSPCNASPLAIRCTTYCVPCEGQTMLLSRLPLGALVTPLAPHNPDENLIPSCKAADVVVGCCWCGASMCPAMSWQDCGQRFHCPFCGKVSQVPQHLVQPTSGVEGTRVDKDRRPELSLGSYEILHSEKHEPAALLLVVDVSPAALRGGHVEFVTQQIHTLLSSLKQDARVGLMTYDNRIHLYDLSPDLSRPHMMVVTETEDLQLPVREGLLVSLRDCAESLDSVLQLLPELGADGDDCDGVPVELPVRAGLAVLQGLECPGKLLIFHSAALMETGNTNSSSGFFGTSKPKSIFQPSEEAVSLAKDCVSQGCGVHLFILSQQDVGGAWPGHVPYLTGGALYTYSYLQGDLDRERFGADLKQVVATDTCYKAELRIFVSKDLRVSGCYGLFVPGPSPAHVTMATLDRRTTLAVELTHTRALDEARGAAVQVVLSYSSQTGEQRSRVHTLTLRSSRHLQDTFRNCQAQTLLTFYCKKMYCSASERPLQELREELQTEVTEALACYRKHGCSSSASAGQLVLPRFLRALPVYINSLRKSEVLLPGLRSSVHQRLQQRCQVLSLDTCSTVRHFYPLLLPLTLPVERSNPQKPEGALRCSAASLEPSGLYLIHAPLALLLWVGSRVPACTLGELFNTSCFSSLPSGEMKLPALENSLSVGVRSLLSTLTSQVPFARKLLVVKQGDTCEEALQRHLVEDKSPNGGASYADFLYHLHINSVRLLQ